MEQPHPAEHHPRSLPEPRPPRRVVVRGAPGGADQAVGGLDDHRAVGALDELIGVDRSVAALDRAARGVERAAGRARWIRADIFGSGDWTRELPAGPDLAVFSLHFHEFLARGELGETLWLYAQSNVLIHHLIGNGRILSLEAWQELFVEAGCPFVATTPTGYLGYQLLAFEL